MSEIVQCRYNRNHKIKQGRLFLHEERCPDKKCSKLIKCPFNPKHKVSFTKIDNHKIQCPDRPQIDEGLHNEMRSFIEAMNKEKKKTQKENLAIKWPKKKKEAELNSLNKNWYIHNNNCIDDKEDLFWIKNENGIIEYDEEDNIEFTTTQSDSKDNFVNKVYIN